MKLGRPSTRRDTVSHPRKGPASPDGRGVAFAADGIALSVDGTTLYSLPTDAVTGWLTSSVAPSALTDRSLSGKVETVGENGQATA